MEIDELKLGNDLHEKIKKSDDLLDCFDWIAEDENGNVTNCGSRNPRLIIEFDGNDDDRETMKVPFVLNPVLIEMIKDFIRHERFKLAKEFKEL